MPIYEYACQQCERISEHLVFGSTNDNEIECPSCGIKGRCKRLLSVFGTVSTSGATSSAASSCDPRGRFR